MIECNEWYLAGSSPDAEELLDHNLLKLEDTYREEGFHSSFNDQNLSIQLFFLK